MNDLLDLLEAEIPHLRRYARYLTRNVDSADDLVQDALVNAISNLSKWQRGTNLRAWLFVIMRNSFISDARRAGRNPAKENFDFATSALGVPANQETAYYLSQLARVFDHLPAEHQEVLSIVVVEGMSYEEAAIVLDVPLGTVRSRLSRARSSLRQAMDGGFGGRGRLAAADGGMDGQGRPDGQASDGGTDGRDGSAAMDGGTDGQGRPDGQASGADGASERRPDGSSSSED